MKNPTYGNNSRIPYSEGPLPPKHFSKFKFENVIKMKHKPEPDSHLSNEIKIFCHIRESGDQKSEKSHDENKRKIVFFLIKR
jgi:hypothetical protein